MKSQPSAQSQARRRTSRLAPLVALTVLLTVPLYYASIRDSSKKLRETSTSYEFPEEPKNVTSRLEAPNKSNNDVPCSFDSGICREGDRVPDTEGKHDGWPPPQKKRGKGRRRRRRPRRHEANYVVARKESSDWISGNDSPPEENVTQPVSGSNNDIVATGNNDSPVQENGRKAMARGVNDRLTVRSRLLDDGQCDLFSGEWVPHPVGPYYTNETCFAIQEHQNCMKFGRPDRGFLKWRWKPDDCELPVFDPERFLELVRGKSVAFVGDSVARNHMQSLICLLSRVEYPEDLSNPVDQNRRYEYRKHDFNISMFWAPYLVKTEKTDPDDEKRPFKLYLDEFDEHWTTKIAFFDYLIISAGHWFFRPTHFYLNNRLVGCLYCPEPNISHLTSYFSYRRAFRTAFRAINAANFSGVAFLRTFAPSHFEGAPWDKGGDCVRTRPFMRNETVMEDYSKEMYLTQLEELRLAQKAGRRDGRKLRLFDATGVMQLRPDGHPSKYGHWPVANQTFASDCVHWCLPGPIDSWNDFLQELLRRELQRRL